MNNFKRGFSKCSFTSFGKSLYSYLSPLYLFSHSKSNINRMQAGISTSQAVFNA